MENWLNSNTGTDNGEPAFKIEGKTYKVEKDMTWAQWIESEYNTDKYRIEGNSTNGVVLKNDSIDTIKYCPKTTQIALAKDTIIVGQNYTLSTIKLPIYWYLSETGEYVSVTDENELPTALNNKAQLAHCPDETSSDAAEWDHNHIGLHNHSYFLGEFVDSSVQSNGELILTSQIAIPYYKYGEEMKEFNDTDTTTIQELLVKMGIDTSEELKTTDGMIVDISEYQSYGKIPEIYLTNSQNDRKYDINGLHTIMIKYDLLKDKDKDRLLILCIEANSDNVSFIELQDFDSKTGEMTIELSKLGAIAVLYKTTE